MKYIAALIACLAVGCTATPSAELRSNADPVLDVYQGIADETGLFIVDVGADAPLIQVYCTDLAGVRRNASFTYEDEAIEARCEPGGSFMVSVVH